MDVKEGSMVAMLTTAGHKYTNDANGYKETAAGKVHAHRLYVFPKWSKQ